MFVDLDWPLNASRRLSASAELLVSYFISSVSVFFVFFILLLRVIFYNSEKRHRILRISTEPNIGEFVNNRGGLWITRHRVFLSNKLKSSGVKFKKKSPNYQSTKLRWLLRRWLQLRFDFDSTAIWPRHYHSTTYVTTALLHCGLRK